MAIPKPEPSDWIRANAQELQATDREVLAMLRDASKHVNDLLADLIAKDSPLISAGVRRAQLEQTRSRLLAEQAKTFERLGDIVSARRLRAASRAQRLSAAGDAALLSLVGKGPQGQFLYESALHTSQRAIDSALARMRLSAVPLSERIYRSSVWMGGRLSKMINETLATGLNARDFAKRARDWFSPNTPGGVRYAAMRLARTEINNSFHAISAEKYATTPWITKVDWNLSKSHPKPDICNEVNAESPYPSDDVPARPHPQCMCYITPVSIDEDEFVENFLDGDYDEYLDSELEKNGWQVPETEQRSAAVETVPNVKEVPLPHVPATLRNHPGLTNDFDKSQAMGFLFGFGSPNLEEKAQELTPDKVLDAALTFQTRQILITSFAPDKLQFLRSVDEQFAQKTGQSNTHRFERMVVDYLGTPAGAEKAREIDEKLSAEVFKLKDADALTRAAEELNGSQPQLPTDSSEYQSWEPSKAQQVWDSMQAARPLSAEELKGLRYYSTTPGFSTMNGLLRGTRKVSEKDQVKAREGIQNAQSGLRPNPEPVLVTRLTNAEQFKDLGGNNNRLSSLVGLVGKTFKDRGFTSTAVKGGNLSAGGVRLEIEVPVGVPMAYMEKLTSHKGENEIMLSKDLEFQILRVEIEGKDRVNMRVRVSNWPGK